MLYFFCFPREEDQLIRSAQPGLHWDCLPSWCHGCVFKDEPCISFLISPTEVHTVLLAAPSRLLSKGSWFLSSRFLSLFSLGSVPRELFVPGLLTSFFCPPCDRACEAGQCSASVKLTGCGTCSESLRFEAERRKSHFGLKIKRHSRTQFNKLEGQQIFDSLLNDRQCSKHGG